MFDFNKNLSLEQKIGQMLIVGFRGLSVRQSDIVFKDVAERNIGGVIFFDQEMADRSLQERNVRSPEQVRELTDFLQEGSETPLLIAIDQEGGRVNRLKKDYGFPETLSHEELGHINDLQFTEEHARKIAKVLQTVGINLNIAPVVDLDANPNNPIIKGKKRSFSSDPEMVAAHAAAFIKGHRAHGILTCPKHFPGHGSAAGDTHLGMVNVTDTWRDEELLPYRRLIGSGLCDLVMSAHVYNSRLDPNHPATLSVSILTGMLRHELGFRGLILSDDMEMRAITSHYGLEKAVLMAIEAGIDLLCFGNNMSFDPNIAAKVISIISQHVNKGNLSEERIDQSFKRIQKIKKDWLVV
ncbi:MAG: glycoside hydrolase family 3 protein [Verrucomicrobiales bacterium]